jgi:hypothetical protein
MVACAPGWTRLSAGLPAIWSAGNTTGMCDTQINELAIFRSPRRPPPIMAAYTQGCSSPLKGARLCCGESN